MKNIILVLALALFSCEKEEVEPTTQQIQTTTIDCNCDRVVSSSSFNMPDGSSFGNYSTFNDCTNQTKDLAWNSNNGETKPVVGSCK